MKENTGKNQEQRLECPSSVQFVRFMVCLFKAEGWMYALWYPQDLHMVHSHFQMVRQSHPEVETCLNISKLSSLLLNEANPLAHN